MKLTSDLKTLTTVCAVALTQLGSPAQAKQDIPGVAEQPAAYFYTGKPYDSDLGSYVFNARNYNPEINRWISADPSGFPDGANASAYAPVPTYMFDRLGFRRETYDQYFGRAYSTLITVVTQNSRSISLTGIEVSGGASGSGIGGAINLVFSIQTTAVVITKNQITELTNQVDNQNPTGDGWQQTGNFTMTRNETSTSKIQDNLDLGSDRFQSKWSSDTRQIGYQQWEREVE